ncbi:hypothetical protein GGH96_000277 [Coemansia sp. RSA 1972]|nr:hypothetical protein GGH96_000277 [Coemansia sp. RSA 1972]
MAGIVMSTHHADEAADQLSSQTAGSPYHYTNHKDTETTGRMSAQGSAYTDVETDPGTDAAPNGAHKTTQRVHRAGDSAKTNGALAHTPAMGMRKRGDSRAASHHIYRYRSHASAKSHKPLVDARLYRRAFSTEPTHSHYEKAMRRSAHRLVSATTRFDRVTTGALSLLADIARMYLMRLGEACKARADLANRAEPNLYDIGDLETAGLGIEWSALREWADEWRAEAGDVVTDRAQTEGSGEVQSTVSRRAVDSEFDRLIGSSANDGDIYDIIGSLDLESLLLGDQDVTDDTETIIPPHLPPLVSMVDDETPEEPLTIPQPESAEDSVNSKVQAQASVPNGDSDYPERPMSPESESEETPESITAHMLHLASSSLSALPPTVTSNKALYAFFRPATKADPSCAPEDVLPSFDIPDPALTPAPEYIKDRLSRKEKLPPGVPMFLAAESPQRDVLGDIECQWREARHNLYDGIYEEAAERAIDEMSNAPVPMRKRRASDASEKEAQFDLPIDGEETGPPERSENVDLDISIDDDVVVMDLDMDMDLDLDIMNVLSDDKPDGDSELEPRPTNGALIGQPVCEDEPMDLPKSNGLRGSGAAHWSNEWFTPAMGDRLSRITAQDILPCDSLFMSSPTAGQRHVVDEVARAFVDSEGGGHMHETTPLEGFGPPLNIFKVPSASGSALRWTLHHIMQTRGLNTVDSLYAGRASLAGGIAGDGIDQYATRVCSLIKGSAEEEAALVVNGARADPSHLWTDRRIHPGPAMLEEQLVAGVVKRIPWAQERMDMHVLEARVVGREPQPAVTKQVVLTSMLPPTPSVAPASSPGYTVPVDHRSSVDLKASPDHKALSVQSTPLAQTTPPADNVLLVHSVTPAHTVPLIQSVTSVQNALSDQTPLVLNHPRPDQTPPFDTTDTDDIIITHDP